MGHQFSSSIRKYLSSRFWDKIWDEKCLTFSLYTDYKQLFKVDNIWGIYFCPLKKRCPLFGEVLVSLTWDLDRSVLEEGSTLTLLLPYIGCLCPSNYKYLQTRLHLRIHLTNPSSCGIPTTNASICTISRAALGQKRGSLCTFRYNYETFHTSSTPSDIKFLI